jgi:hypothetical protein
MIQQPTLPCENGGGSLNNPNAPPAQTGLNNTALKPYVPPALPIGDWQITGINPDICAQNEALNQQTYVAETINISGAPLNIYPLLGIHQQGNGSVLSQGRIIGSTSYPGYPLTGLNQPGQSWWSSQQGSAVTNTAYVGVDFGIKLLANGRTEYEPEAQKWVSVGAINLTQSNNPGQFAQQVKVEITSGDVSPGITFFSGTGNGVLTTNGIGSDATQSVINIVAISSMTFNVYATLPDSTTINLGTLTSDIPFYSTFLNLTIASGSTPFAVGDMFMVPLNYNWKRVGLYNMVQSPLPQTLNLNTLLKVKAIMVTPTMFTGTGSWEVVAFDVLDEMPTTINNIQDLFFNENRDREYGLVPIPLKAQYSPADSVSDLARFGLNILEQYTFVVSFATMVKALGRPIVVGDIIEVIPEMQYDQNLLPIRKFLEVTDAAWQSSGFGPLYNPTTYRFSGQQALPSQETRDIFGTMDTQKYLIADALFTNGVGQQIDTLPLTNTEEIIKNAADAVPEVGSDDRQEIAGIVEYIAPPPRNPSGQPLSAPVGSTPNLYIEDGLPKNGEPYTEGYTLPPIAGVADGAYFRLYYPPETVIAPRLYRFSTVKNAWLFLEQDKRGLYTSAKPSIRSIMQSATRVPLGGKV